MCVLVYGKWDGLLGLLVLFCCYVGLNLGVCFYVDPPCFGVL